MVRPILAAEFVFDMAAGDLGAKPGRVLEELGPGERTDNAKTVGEAMFDFREQGVITVLAPRIVVFGDAAQNLDRVQHLIERDGLAAADAAVYSGELIEGIGNLLVPDKLVDRAAARIELRRAELLP